MMGGMTAQPGRGRQPWQSDLDRKRIVTWQCSENPKHRGWRDESKPEEVGRRGTCDICLARTSFEREFDPSTGHTELPEP